jgi:hypothetical protein
MGSRYGPGNPELSKDVGIIHVPAIIIVDTDIYAVYPSTMGNYNETCKSIGRDI